VAYVKTARTTR